MGVIVFAVIFNLLTQLNLATEWQQIVKGVIILAAVLIQRPERDLTPDATLDASRHPARPPRPRDQSGRATTPERKIHMSRHQTTRRHRRPSSSSSPPPAPATTTAATADATEPPHGGAGSDDGCAGSGETVTIVASVPPTDHGWLGQIAAKAQEAADQWDDVEFRLLEAADADSQASQIETVINEKPDAIVVLPYDGDAAHPVAETGDGGRHPGDQRRPALRHARGGPRHDPRATTTAIGVQGRDVHRRTSSTARATS